MYDLILQGGTIIDGTGSAPYIADIGIKDGKIAAIEPHIAQNENRLDASGYIVSPGFIDIHRHGDAEVFREGFGSLELKQGLTSIVNGACGLSLAPFGNDHRDELLRYLQPVTGKLNENIPTDSMKAYLGA